MVKQLQGYLDKLKGDLTLLKKAEKDGEITPDQYSAIYNKLTQDAGKAPSPLHALEEICDGKLTSNKDQQGALMSANDGLTMAFHVIYSILHPNS